MSETPDSPGRVPAYSWYALGVLFVVYLVNFVDRQILSILANDIKADLHIGDAELGFLYGTAFAIFYSLFGIPLGRLADGWRRTRLLSLGLTLWSAMTMLSGLARGPAPLAMARVGVGVGEATANPCAYSLIAGWFPPRLRATALGLYSSGLFVGSGLSLLFGGAVAESWNRAWPGGGPGGLVGWQAAFIAVGIPGLVLAAWVLTLREPPVDPQREAPWPRPWRRFWIEASLIVFPFTLLGAARRGGRALGANVLVALALAGLAWIVGRATGNYAQFGFVAAGIYAVATWAAALRQDDPDTFRLTFGSRAFVGATLAYAAICFLGYTVSYWAAPYGERTFGLGKVQLGWWLGAPAALGGFLGVIVGGWLADRLQRRHAAGRLWVLALALVLSTPLIATAYTTTQPRLFLLCSFCVQATTSLALGAAAAATQSLVAPRMRGTAGAIFLLGPALIGLAFGPFTAGYVSELSGSLGAGVIATLGIVPLGLLALALSFRSFGEDSRRAEALA